MVDRKGGPPASRDANEYRRTTESAWRKRRPSAASSRTFVSVAPVRSVPLRIPPTRSSPSSASRIRSSAASSTSSCPSLVCESAATTPTSRMASAPTVRRATLLHTMRVSRLARPRGVPVPPSDTGSSTDAAPSSGLTAGRSGGSPDEDRPPALSSIRRPVRWRCGAGSGFHFPGRSPEYRGARAGSSAPTASRDRPPSGSRTSRSRTARPVK